MLWIYDKDKGGRRKASARDAGLETHFHSITLLDGTRGSDHRMTSTLAARLCSLPTDLHRAQEEITRLPGRLPERICADSQTAT